ncbi:MAG: hypothetical protein V3V99_10920 [candidate division Zixibacteria bacterium]
MKSFLIVIMVTGLIQMGIPIYAEDTVETLYMDYVDFDGDGINDNIRDNDGNGIPDDFERKSSENKIAPSILGQSLNQSLNNNASIDLYLNNREAFGAREFHVLCHSSHRVGFTSGQGFGVGNGIGLGNIASGCAGGVCGI